MKKLISLIATGLICLCGYSQDNGETLSITAIQPEDSRFSEESKQNLETKMQRIIQNGGLHSGDGSRFIMTSRIDVTEKDITSQGMFLQKMDISFYILDIVEDKVFGMTSIPVVGVGETETKALIKAFQNIKPTSPKLSSFITATNTAIQNYFRQEMPRIIADAELKAQNGDFDGAYILLLTVPSICHAEYDLCRSKAIEINDLQRKKQRESVNKEGRSLIQKAKALWSGKHDYDTAKEALELLAKVDPGADCVAEVNDFMATISENLRDTEKAEAEFKKQQYEDRIQFERQKEENKAAILNTLVGRFGRFDLSVQKDKTYRFGSAKQQ